MRPFLAAIALAFVTAWTAHSIVPYVERDPPSMPWPVNYLPLPDGSIDSVGNPTIANVDGWQFKPGTVVVNLPMPLRPPIELAAHRKVHAVKVALLREAERAVGKGAHQLGVRPDLWCADAINAFLRRIDIRGTGSALAASFVHWGRPAKPGPGVIAVKSRRGGNHVVVIKQVKRNSVVTISPNSGGKVRTMTYPIAVFYAFREPKA